MYMLMALPCTCAWISHGRVHGVALHRYINGHPDWAHFWTTFRDDIKREHVLACCDYFSMLARPFKSSVVQRAKNPVSASALLTEIKLRIRKIFARMVYNVSLTGPILSRLGVNHTQIIWMVSNCSYNMIIASGHFRMQGWTSVHFSLES